MTHGLPLVADRTVLFADLRGSTALYETLGNQEATSVVTQTVSALGNTVPHVGGQLVKTLGDGLMAVYATPAAAVQSAFAMHEALENLVQHSRARGGSPALRGLKLQVGLARGETVEMAGDCFGDAVNIAARLIDHAGDNEILATVEVLHGLSDEARRRFRALDWVRLRGRAEAVHVHVADGRGASEVSVLPATQFGPVPDALDPEAVRLRWHVPDRVLEQVFDGGAMPLVIGRSPSADFRIDDSRVSRSHARIDWHGATFQLTDLSYNGTYVRFGDGGDVVSLRRGRLSLHGHGRIGLGGMPDDARAACVEFEVLSACDTVPQPLT